MVQKPNHSWSQARSFFILTFFLFVIYNSNLRWFLTRDSIPARVLPFSVLLNRHLYLDGWIEPYFQGKFAHGAYYVTKAQGHWYSVYPIIEPLVVTPLYILPAWWLTQQAAPPAQGSFVLITIINTMEKLSAALLAALSAGVLYLALRKYVSPRASLVIALVYALGSNTWCTSSQTLWRHGFSEFSFALLLWALPIGPGAPANQWVVGLALALAAADKPVFVLIAIPVLIYYARTHRKSLFILCVPLLAVGIPVLIYNFYLFHRLLGAYPSVFAAIPMSNPMNPARYPWWDGFAGLLVSPNRGLFIFTPWVILALWGGARVWKEHLYGWGRYLIVGMVAVYVTHARLGLWWGGGCFGPRYMTDLLPFLAFFLVPIWPRILFSRLATLAFVISVAAAFWIQIIGAYFYANGNWDAYPMTVEVNPQRVWDWSDTQIMRTWRAGPDRPTMLYQFPSFIDALRFESGKPKTRLAVIGLDHDHVWRMFKEIGKEPAAELIAVADPHAELVAKAREQTPAGVKFYDDYVRMLDEMKPDAVVVTTSTDRHLEILRECAKRHIHFSVEKPMALTAGEARQMASLASAANIKLMVNYWNAWAGSSQELHARLRGGKIGPVQKIGVQYGHEGPREIEVSKYFADWLYDPAKNGGGALMDFGCYGAEWALWLKGRPSSVYAYSLKLKTGQANAVDDDAVILLRYPDATATIEASWDWPFERGQVEVFGPRGSMRGTDDALFYQVAGTRATIDYPEGRPLDVGFVLHETSSAIAYFVYHIRHDQPIEDPVSAGMNVAVMEILDAAKESIRTGRAVELP